MKRMTCIMLLALCLLCMTACGKSASEETAAMPTSVQPTAPVTKAAAETTEPAGPQLLERPENGKICVGFLPTEAGSWRYAVIEDQEAALAAYEKASGSIYSDEWWIKGDRTKGLMVVADGQFWDFVESGELVYALGRVKAEDAADLYELCVAAAAEAGWKEAVRPDQLKNIRSATLRISGKEILLTEEKRVDKLEKILSVGEYELGGTGCPFTAWLDVTVESGEILTVSLATDSCGVWMSEGYYYSFGSEYDSQSLYDLFGITLEFGELKE